MAGNNTFSEAIEYKVNKRNKKRAGENFFNSLVLLNDPEYLRKNPEWRGQLAFCIYCAKIQQEYKFPELHSNYLVPYNGARRLRHGVCAECKQNTSNTKK